MKIPKTRLVSIDGEDLTTVIKRLQEVQDEIKGRARFKVDTYYAGCGDVDIYVDYEEEETEAECKQREKQEEKSKALRRKQYEALKKEFAK